jgi:hypothetical protein
MLDYSFERSVYSCVDGDCRKEESGAVVKKEQTQCTKKKG